MSPVSRTISGSLLSLRLEDEMRALDAELGGEHTRIGRTLIKEGPLRVTLVGLAPGGTLHAHEAEGPITIQVLRGTLSLDAGGSAHDLAAGDLAALDAGVRHAASSRDGAVFLLTVAAAKAE